MALLPSGGWLPPSVAPRRLARGRLPSQLALLLEHVPEERPAAALKANALGEPERGAGQEAFHPAAPRDPCVDRSHAHMGPGPALVDDTIMLAMGIICLPSPLARLAKLLRRGVYGSRK